MKTRGLIEQILYCICLSIASFIVLFSWLKFIPISLTTLVQIVAIISVILLCIFKKKPGKFTWSDSVPIIFLGFISYIFVRLFWIYLAPAGADMATHTYTAEVIVLSSGFPRTFEPIVPIHTFGFAPFGMPVLIALFSMFASLEIQKSALLITLLIYPCLASSLYLFLRNYYSRIISISTITLLLLVSKDVVRYLYWGGNPTPLSIGFLIVAISYFVSTHVSHIHTFFRICIASILLVASFYTHQAPFIYFMYCLIPVTCILLYKKKYFIIRQLIILGFCVAVLLLPFIYSIQPLTSVTWNQVMHGIRAPYFNISNIPADTLFTVNRFVIDRIGERQFILLVLGVILAFVKGASISLWFGTSIVMLYILLCNSPFWLLPLSGLLFPDRILTTAIIPISYFVGFTLNVVYPSFRRSIFASNYSTKIIISFCIFLFSTYMYNNAKSVFQEMVVQNMNTYVSVTQNDLNAFAWMKKNTTSHDTIMNNYGDAGVWIPSIAQRKISYNDSYAHYLGELRYGEKLFTYSYIYIGDKLVYPNSGINMSTIMADADPNLMRVYTSGNAVIYKCITPCHDLRKNKDGG